MNCTVIEGRCEPVLESDRNACDDGARRVNESPRGVLDKGVLDRLVDLSLMLFRYRFIRAELFERAMRELGRRESR